MMYKAFTVGKKEYKAILNASSAVMVEEKLGENPLNFVIEMAQNDSKMPSLQKLLVILHASLQKYQHGIKMEDVYDIYDEFIADGNQMTDLLPLILDIFEASGFFKKPEEDENPKNA